MTANNNHKVTFFKLRIFQLKRLLLLSTAGLSAFGLSNAALSSPLNIQGFLSSSITKTNHSTPYIEAKEYTDNINYQSGTVVGLMLSKRLDSKVNFQGQLTARGATADKSHSYKPEFDLLFMDYKLRPNMSVKVGKLIPNTYLISKHLDVGASYLWARPPVEVYETSYSFLTRVNGVELTYQKKLGSYNLRIQPYIGRLSETLISRTTRTVASLDSESLVGFSAELETQGFHLHASAMNADSIMTDGDGSLVYMPDTAIYSLGAKAERNGWMALAEVAHVDVGRAKLDFTSSVIDVVKDLGVLEADIPPQTGYYITLAHEIKAFTPYLTWASTNAKQKLSDNSTLNAINNNFLQEQKSLSLGTRYYASNSLTLKLEYHQADILNGTTGLFIAQPTKDDDLQLWTASFNILL
jgi:hypothetical protein